METTVNVSEFRISYGRYQNVRDGLGLIVGVLLLIAGETIL